MDEREKATHSATMGAITLQGPHHSAKQSSSTTGCWPSLLARASWNSCLLFNRVTAVSDQVPLISIGSVSTAARAPSIARAKAFGQWYEEHKGKEGVAEFTS